MGKSSQHHIGRSLLRAGAAFVALSVLIRPLAAAPEDEVRAAFERFVAAQNEHDAKAVESLLLDSPNFLWITRGTPVWGADAAMKRFATLYQGTWRLDPDAASLKVMMLSWERADRLHPPATARAEIVCPIPVSHLLMGWTAPQRHQRARMKSLIANSSKGIVHGAD